jgi:catechol 2,3-dioxygenase-like lactoylglutathione lyase family enzyme
LESLILFVSDLQASKAFYADGLGLPVLVNKGDILALVRGEEEGSRAVVPAWL